MNVCAVLPALNPDERFLTVVRQLVEKGYQRIIIVNDGSGEAYRAYFEQAAQYPQCVVLTHSVNLGKGRALKTAFNYYLAHRGPEEIGVVTLDADGQHDIEDIVAVSQCLDQTRDGLVLGCRNFNDPAVPPRSRAGNKTTRLVLRLLLGIKITDTQTGLRAIPNDLIEIFLQISGERFEFETNMLIENKKLDRPFYEVQIKTLYLDGNRSSHFQTLRDSVKIYMLIVKFLSASILSFVIDILMFMLFSSIFGFLIPKVSILIGTVAARVISSVFNYLVNKNLVFNKEKSVRVTFLKYYVICIVQMAASYFAVIWLAYLTRLDPVLIKIVVDTILFLISYQFQREWVFKKRTKSRAEV